MTADQEAAIRERLDQLMLPRNPEARVTRIEEIVAERNNLEAELAAARERLAEGEAALREIAATSAWPWSNAAIARAYFAAQEQE